MKETCQLNADVVRLPDASKPVLPLTAFPAPFEPRRRLLAECVDPFTHIGTGVGDHHRLPGSDQRGIWPAGIAIITSGSMTFRARVG